MYKKLLILLIVVSLVGLTVSGVAANNCGSKWADFTIDRYGNRVEFTACYDLEKYYWSFGDGESETTYQGQVKHFYEPGVYYIKLKGQNKYGHWSEVTHRIDIPSQKTEVSMKLNLDKLSSQQRAILAVGTITGILLLLSK